jgi:hypothetical protein
MIIYIYINLEHAQSLCFQTAFNKSKYIRLSLYFFPLIVVKEH